MPRIDQIGDLAVGQRVLVGRRGRGDYEGRALFHEREEAVIKWFYASDVDGSQWVYVELDRPLFHHPRTDAMGNTRPGDPCFGPFEDRGIRHRCAAPLAARPDSSGRMRRFWGPEPTFPAGAARRRSPIVLVACSEGFPPRSTRVSTLQRSSG